MPFLIPVILCGGAGTRLWPVSREGMRKQFIALMGQGSTFQQVMRRVCDAELFGRPIVHHPFGIPFHCR
jgi:mannose-1-phosphate guanylyltransferase